MRKSQAATTFVVIRQSLYYLCAGKLSRIPAASVQLALSELSDQTRCGVFDTVAELRSSDPLEEILLGGGTAEQRYVRQMCRYLEERDRYGRPDEFAATVFWQTVRVRNLLYRYVTQRPMTPGLAWFIRFYSQMGKARGHLSLTASISAAIQTSGSGAGLRSLEFRTRPEATVEGLKRDIDGIMLHVGREHPAA
jgi:hypothetical protein